MTVERARSFAPARVSMQPVLHSKSQTKREWGYDSESRKAYVIFGKPGGSIALYEYWNVTPEVARAIQESAYDSKAISDLLVRPSMAGKEYTKLYPPVS